MYIYAYSNPYLHKYKHIHMCVYMYIQAKNTYIYTLHMYIVYMSLNVHVMPMYLNVFVCVVAYIHTFDCRIPIISNILRIQSAQIQVKDRFFTRNRNYGLG